MCQSACLFPIFYVCPLRAPSLAGWGRATMDRQNFRPANQLASDRRKKIRRAAGFPCKKYQLVTFCYFGTEFQRKVPKCSSSWRGAQTFTWRKRETCVRWCFWALSSQNQHSTHVSIFERLSKVVVYYRGRQYTDSWATALWEFLFPTHPTRFYMNDFSLVYWGAFIVDIVYWVEIDPGSTIVGR